MNRSVSWVFSNNSKKNNSINSPPPSNPTTTPNNNTITATNTSINKTSIVNNYRNSTNTNNITSTNVNVNNISGSKTLKRFSIASGSVDCIKGYNNNDSATTTTNNNNNRRYSINSTSVDSINNKSLMKTARRSFGNAIKNNTPTTPITVSSPATTPTTSPPTTIAAASPTTIAASPTPSTKEIRGNSVSSVGSNNSNNDDNNSNVSDEVSISDASSISSTHKRSHNNNHNNNHNHGFYYTTSLYDELDELLDVAIWLDRNLYAKQQNNIHNIKQDIKQCLAIIHNKDKEIRELEKENEMLRKQLNTTQSDKDILKHNLRYEREFSAIMLHLDEEYMDDTFKEKDKQLHI